MSGALFIFRIQHEYTQTQCEEGASYVIVVLLGNIKHLSLYKKS